MANKNGVIGTIKEGFAESTRNVRDINKANMAAVKADTKANFDAATEPDPGFVKFKEAKGLGNKVKVIGENIKEGAREQSEITKEHIAYVQSHESLNNLLEEQRANRQATIDGTRYGRKRKTV